MISAINVRKAFGEVLALDGVSLEIRRSERVAFVGANGSGKTTLLRALLGIVRADGSISIDGIDVSKHPELALRSVAYIPQIAPPIEASVEELVRAHAALREQNASATYERAGYLGLDVGTSKKKRFRDLSGGMKQKLLAAMALATEAPILVCDEPTANLDGQARLAFFSLLAERPPSSIVVLCSHRIEEVQQLVERIVEFEDGRVVRDAPLAEVLRSIKGFRIEVTVRAGDAPVKTELEARGFVQRAQGRLVLEVDQAEKMEWMHELFTKHQSELSDIAVVPHEDLSQAASRARHVESSAP